MRRFAFILLIASAAALTGCDHITIGPVQPSCDICGPHGR
jgi:hypothetical protein